MLDHPNHPGFDIMNRNDFSYLLKQFEYVLTKVMNSNDQFKASSFMNLATAIHEIYNRTFHPLPPDFPRRSEWVEVVRHWVKSFSKIFSIHKNVYEHLPAFDSETQVTNHPNVSDGRRLLNSLRQILEFVNGNSIRMERLKKQQEQKNTKILKIAMISVKTLIFYAYIVLMVIYTVLKNEYIPTVLRGVGGSEVLEQEYRNVLGTFLKIHRVYQHNKNSPLSFASSKVAMQRIRVLLNILNPKTKQSDLIALTRLRSRKKSSETRAIRDAARIKLYQRIHKKKTRNMRQELVRKMPTEVWNHIQSGVHFRKLYNTLEKRNRVQHFNHRTNDPVYKLAENATKLKTLSEVQQAIRTLSSFVKTGDESSTNWTTLAKGKKVNPRLVSFFVKQKRSGR